MNGWAVWACLESHRLALERRAVVKRWFGAFGLKRECDRCFIFETLDPPGTVVPAQDENSFLMFEGTFDLYVDGSWTFGFSERRQVE